MDEEWVLISSYSRNEAIADGVLIDITALASQRGFRLPTAITATLLGRYLEPSEKLKDMGQSFEGRLHDLLYMTFLAAKNSKDSDRDSWKTFCLFCAKKYYLPVCHLVTLTELKKDWENKKHILFNHPKTKTITCIHTGEVFEAPIEFQFFMTLEAMKNEFYPRLNKYGEANYGLIKDNWRKIIEFEPEIEEMLTINPHLVFMICKGIYEEMNKNNRK